MRPAPSGWRHGLAALGVLLALAGAPDPAVGQASPAAALELSVQGRVERPRTISLDDLLAVSPVTVRVEFQGSHGGGASSYTGAPLWSLLEAAKPIDEPGQRTALRHTVLARGRDGYAAAMAIGELDPHFEGKQVLVAYAQDGKPLPGLRLVIPGDAHAGRNVRDLVAIEVR